MYIVQWLDSLTTELLGTWEELRWNFHLAYYLDHYYITSWVAPCTLYDSWRDFHRGLSEFTSHQVASDLPVHVLWLAQKAISQIIEISIDVHCLYSNKKEYLDLGLTCAEAFSQIIFICTIKLLDVEQEIICDCLSTRIYNYIRAIWRHNTFLLRQRTCYGQASPEPLNMVHHLEKVVQSKYASQILLYLCRVFTNS